VFGETSISACNDRIILKQRLRWATPQTSTLGSYTKENPYTISVFFILFYEPILSVLVFNVTDEQGTDTV